MSVRIDELAGIAPVQAEGVLLIDDVEYPFYFRFRADRAQMYIWKPDRPKDFFNGSELAHYEQCEVTGRQYNGYLPDDKARALIDQWAIIFEQTVRESQLEK